MNNHQISYKSLVLRFCMASNFLFHEVSEKEKQEIQKEAKKIMDSFSKKLSKIDKKISEPLIERREGEREEGKGKCSEIDREIMFENASNKKIIGTKNSGNFGAAKSKTAPTRRSRGEDFAGFIIAEKKGW